MLDLYTLKFLLWAFMSLRYEESAMREERPLKDRGLLVDELNGMRHRIA
jgi:hypothetical protein